jgi:hypothetical protein
MPTSSRSHPIVFNLVFGFIAGFLATLIFHQLVMALLWKIGMAPGPPYQMAPRPPFGVPAVISLAFWGGVWGIFFAAIDKHFPRKLGYWLTALFGGAILPSLVALLVVVPLKGGPVGAGWNPHIWLFAFIVNGAWGVGTGLILLELRRYSGIAHSTFGSMLIGHKR